MTAQSPRFYFDYVDPLSYLLELEIREIEQHTGHPILRLALELRAPPSPLIHPRSEHWMERCERAALIARERHTVIARPQLVPWTRKAHELVLHAASQGSAPEVHAAIFDAFHLEGLDIGRVDVLVQLAVDTGLDGGEAKAVLDVDKHTADVESARRLAMAGGIERVPTVAGAQGRLEGFQNRTALSTFLHL